MRMRSHRLLFILSRKFFNHFVVQKITLRPILGVSILECTKSTKYSNNSQALQLYCVLYNFELCQKFLPYIPWHLFNCRILVQRWLRVGV